jgi:hypothetical protein
MKEKSSEIDGGRQASIAASRHRFAAAASRSSLASTRGKRHAAGRAIVISAAITHRV